MTQELQVITPPGVAKSFDAAALGTNWQGHLADLVPSDELARALWIAARASTRCWAIPTKWSATPTRPSC
jgi:hypothetical protein